MNKDKQMKLRNLLIALGLTLTVGAGVAVATYNENHHDDIQEANAWGPRVDINFYIAYSGSYTVKVWYNAGYDCTDLVTASKVVGATYNETQIYSAGVKSSSEQSHYFNNLRVQLFDGSTCKQEYYLVDDGGWNRFSNDGKIFICDSEEWVPYSVDTYRIKCGSGNYIAMTYDDGGSLPSGCISQYSATLNITAGESLSIQRNSSVDLSPSYSGDSNNYYSNEVIITVSNAKIWLKYKSDGTYDVWVPGYTSCAVIVGGTQYTTTTEGDDEVTNLIYIEKDQTVTVSWAHIPISTYLNGGSTSGCFSGDGGTVTCLLTGAYIVKVCYNSYHSEKNDVYIERNNASTAKYLAQKFNSTISSICTAVVSGSKSLSDLQAAWGSNSSSDLYKHFNGQPSTITAYFGTSSGTTDSDILACVARYDYIERKYGTTALPDFLGRNNSYPTSAQNHILISLFGQSGGLNSSIIVIVVIASLGLLSVGGYYFFRKSRKTEE